MSFFDLESFRDLLGFNRQACSIIDRAVMVMCPCLFLYSSKSFIMSSSYYGQGSGEVVVSDLACTGAEDDIGHCKATWWTQISSLSHNNDVGVSCDGSTFVI